jgi:DHA2 family multidrug resistance protein-like MFS transporter
MEASHVATKTTYQGSNKLLLGIVLAVLTFWLFAGSLVNVVPAMHRDLRISAGVIGVAISLTALFSGICIVVAGGLADRFGRMRFTYIGLGLNMLGSLCLVLTPSGTVALLLVGRIIQGISGACIMPATLSLVKAYYAGAARQRAVSFWSIGSWGGSGVSSLAGGAIATSLGWRWIFVFSIVVALISVALIWGTPESRMESPDRSRFDVGGLTAFVIAMVAINVIITQGSALGWVSWQILVLAAAFVIALPAFIKLETTESTPFVDFTLFYNRAYSGATVSNFLLNASAGTLIVVNTFVQTARGLSSFQSGLLTIGYLVCVVGMIRVGEKLMQRMGARQPMIWGSAITGLGILLTACTFLPGTGYLIIVFVGFALFGVGLGMYATPSTDTAVDNAPAHKVGVATGIYKMASSLGSAFGVALSSALYVGLSAGGSAGTAAMIALLFNVAITVAAIIAVIVTMPTGVVASSP